MIEKIIINIEYVNLKMFLLTRGDDDHIIDFQFLSFFKYLKPLKSVVNFTKKFFFIKYFAKLNAGKICPPVPPVAINIFLLVI